jgi:PIN domain nuclease of toxin-antitoxin system
VRYLLDTQVIIWYFESNKRVPSHIKEIIDNPLNDICISHISLWEIALKLNIFYLFSRRDDKYHELPARESISLR